MARKSKYERNYEIETENDRERYIGKIFQSRNCGDFKVLGVYDRVKTGRGNKRYICKFINTGTEVVSKCDSIISGYLRDCYAPTVFDIGYTGTYDKLDKEIYIIWKSMFQRCYDSEYIKVRPNYSNAYVSSHWHNFSNFADDIDKILGYKEMKQYINERFELDKDILVHNNKEYCLEKVCFVPSKLNSFFRGIRSDNITGYTGIYPTKSGRFNVTVGFNGNKKNVGTFKVIEDALNARYRARVDILNRYFKEDLHYIDSKIKVACHDKLKISFMENIDKEGVLYG